MKNITQNYFVLFIMLYFLNTIFCSHQVLGGKVRRKKLLSPKDRDVRPMMEVVRGAAFDMLQVLSFYEIMGMCKWMYTSFMKTQLWKGSYGWTTLPFIFSCDGSTYARSCWYTHILGDLWYNSRDVHLLFELLRPKNLFIVRQLLL